MVRLTGAFSLISEKKILIAGDLMLDCYTIGKARRISPEAPVVVVEVAREEERPGGAGNVMLNLRSMGAQVVCLGRVGQDKAGRTLKEELLKEQIDVIGLVEQSQYSTPCKNRIIAEGQQIVRVDYEKNSPLPELLEQQIIENLAMLLKDVDLVALSDYGKGFLTKTLIAAVIEECKSRNIPVLTDPKGIDFTKYSGSYLIKPNLGEAYAAAGLPLDYPIEQVAEKLLQTTQSEVLMITRSEKGISLFYKNNEHEHFPVHIHEIKDVTGAGDTVLATVSIALASGLTIAQAAQLSNIAAGIAIERFGCARVTLSDIAHRLLKFDVVNKVFDEEHLFALKEALKGSQYVLIVISQIEQLTNHLFASIRKIATDKEHQIIVYLDNRNPPEEFVNILASLNEIDYVLLNSNSVKHICSEIEPVDIYHINNNVVTKPDALELVIL